MQVFTSTPLKTYIRNLHCRRKLLPIVETYRCDQLRGSPSWVNREGLSAEKLLRKNSGVLASRFTAAGRQTQVSLEKTTLDTFLWKRQQEQVVQMGYRMVQQKQPKPKALPNCWCMLSFSIIPWWLSYSYDCLKSMSYNNRGFSQHEQSLKQT